ncbi:MAG: Na+/H+ antiporter NhaA, partial [Pseudomonadota bacterium]
VSSTQGCSARCRTTDGRAAILLGDPSDHTGRTRERMDHGSVPHTKPPSSLPPGAWEPLLRLGQRARRPVERFLQVEAASGILLLLAAAIALLWANSRWSASYFALWRTSVSVGIGALHFERSLEWFVNDGLMVIFFFVVGLEIRREIHQGELSEWRRAALPAVAAVGGMLAPAGLYLLLASSPAARAGWGVPMATDIAFAVGILALLGERVPPALRVLLLALAVIDDLGAIIVIAAFYSSGIAWSGLLVAAAGLACVLLLRWFGVRHKPVYVIPGFVIWAGVYSAGIHPTIAGVIIGLITPVRAWLGAEGFVDRVREELVPLRAAGTAVSSQHLANTLHHVDSARREALSPAESLIDVLHPWVAFVIMPVFALANAGVPVAGLDSSDATALSIAAGVGVGLVVGKPIGVLFAIWLTRRLGISILPVGLGPRHLLVLGVVAGVGFTMALFVAQLAFPDARMLAAAKMGVLVASGVAAVFALALGRLLLKPQSTAGAARTAHEAESSTST